MQLDLITDMCDQPLALYQMLEITPLSVTDGVRDIDAAQYLRNLSPGKGCQAEFHCLVIEIVSGQTFCLLVIQL